jgi:alpha-amylase/alpha-mannosidase (GH57 family)
MSQHPAKLVEAARELLKSAGYFVDNLWHIDDVHFICEQQELPRITNEEAEQVFLIAQEQFEGEVGLSWPQLEKALRTYLHRKLMLSRLCSQDRQFS